MNNPRISVVMPAHNREKYIADSIHSILEQSYKDFELIVVDDCSTDNTVNIIKQFNDQRIRLIKHEKNSGVAAARNTGYANSRGEFIAIADSDDINHKDRLLKKIDYFVQNPQVDVVSCWYQEIDDNNKYHNIIKFDTENENIRAHWIFNPGIPSFMMFRKHRLENQRLLYHDTSYKAAVDYQWFTALNENIRLYCLPEVLYYYRRHQAQISTEGFSTQQNFANNIRLKQLNHIGVYPSDEELKVHKRMIYDFAEEVDQKLFSSMITWCEKLQAANAHTKYFNTLHFNKVLIKFLTKIINRDNIYSPHKEELLLASTLANYVETDEINSISLMKKQLENFSQEVNIFGAKKMGYQIKQYLGEHGINTSYFIDNNVNNHYKQLDGCTIIPPSAINNSIETTVIISVLSEARFAIREQLIKQYQLLEENVFTIDDLGYGVF